MYFPRLIVISAPQATMTTDDFHARAAAATARALSAPNPAEALGKSLTDSDVPKITEAAKSYASLIAARSICTTDADASAAASSTTSTPAEQARCTFHKTSDPTRASLMCARSLLLAINSTEIPETGGGGGAGGDDDGTSSSTGISVEQQLEKDVIRVVWNGCLKKSREDKKSGIKPSKALGRRSLVLAYPHVMKRIKQADASLLPAGVDNQEAMAFFEGFGKLLTPKNDNGAESEEDDDHFLLWSTDGGAAELKRRRERRTKRGKEAAAASEDEAKTKIASALTGATSPSSSSVTIEELPDDTVVNTSGES